VRIFFAVPRSAWVDANLRRSLQAMGHELVPFTFPGWPDDDDPDWRARGKPATNERLLRAFRAALGRGPLDLLFGYFYSSVVYPETIDELRRSGVPTVNFSCNNVHQFHLVEAIAARFDLCIVPERAALASFEKVGARPVRIQLAANPAVYHPLPEPREFDVTFVGQRYADRAELLAHLARSGVRVRAWGAGWQRGKRVNLATARAAWSLLEDERWDGVRRLVRARLRRRGRARVAAPPCPEDPALEGPHAIPGDRPEKALESEVARFGGPRLTHADLVRMFSRSRISLGFATAGDSHLEPGRRLTHLRLREFEAPMSGALYLAEEQAELHEYFLVGQELLTYKGADDLVETCRYYLARPEQAERIRRAGHRRALGEHTWQHRFRELFAALHLPA
jgi:spore maturation protein CgeB